MGRNELITGAEGLTDRQTLFVDALLSGKSDQEAREAAGYVSAQKIGSPAAGDAVQAALKTARVARIRGQLATKALEAVQKLIESDATPAATRFSAAKWVLEQAGHVSQDETGKDKPLAEMTEQELQAFIRKTSAVVEAGGSPPVITVTPNGGA